MLLFFRIMLINLSKKQCTNNLCINHKIMAVIETLIHLLNNLPISAESYIYSFHKSHFKNVWVTYTEWIRKCRFQTKTKQEDFETGSPLKTRALSLKWSFLIHLKKSLVWVFCFVETISDEKMLNSNFLKKTFRTVFSMWAGTYFKYQFSVKYPLKATGQFRETIFVSKTGDHISLECTR